MTDELFLPESSTEGKGESSSGASFSGVPAGLPEQLEGQPLLSPKELASALYSVNLLVQQSQEFSQKLGHVCDALVNLCGFSFASVVLFNDTQNALRIRSAHIKTLTNNEGLGMQEFFESVARPGTELIRQYYEAAFQDQYEVVNTYCVPPETTYPILQVSGYSDPEVASYLVRFGVVPQVLDNFWQKPIIPSVQDSTVQKTRDFFADSRPTNIFIALYNGTLASDKNEMYGIYLPVRNSDGKILGLLSLGRRTGAPEMSQEDALAYHCTFEPLIRQLALELENEELRQIVTTGKTNTEMFRPADFTRFIAGLAEQKTDWDKFEFICNQVLNLCKPEIVFGVLFDGNLVIDKTALATRLSDLEAEITQFYGENFSVGSGIHAEFLGALFLPEYQVSNSFFLTDEQLSSIETYSHTRVVFRNGIGRQKTVGQGALFTPIYNNNGLITGYVASVLDPAPNDARPVAEAIEFYTQFIGNAPFVTSGKAQHDQASHRTQFTSVFDLTDSLHYYPTIEEKAQTVARGILRIGGLSSATIVLYDRQDQIEYQRTYSASENDDELPARPSALCKSGGVKKSTSDAIFMTPGFKFNRCYCFSTSQIVLLLRELEAGNEVPIELCSSFIGEENFENFVKDPKVGIFIPMMSGKNIFGYVGLGDPLLDTTLEELKDRVSLLSIFINKAAAHFWQLRLEQESAEQSRGKASLKELLSSLLVTNTQFRSDEPIEKKIEKVINAIVELFGLTYAALVIFDKNRKVAYACHKVHPQSVYAVPERIFEQRFKPGRQLPEQILNAIFSEPFSAGPCAIFKVSQLKAVIRKEPLSYSKKSLTILNEESVSLTTIGLQNISDYLNGDRKTGLMLPLYGEQGRLVGTVGLGSLMFAGNIADATEFIERIKIIGYFADQIFRDYQLSQAEAEREEESNKLRKKNLFIQILLELNIMLAQPIAMHEKIKEVCERSTRNSDFCSISVLLLNDDDLLITDFFQTINPRVTAAGKVPNEFDLQGKAHLDREFLSRALGKENLVGNSYCTDFRQIAGYIQVTGNSENLVILDNAPVPYTSPVSAEDALGYEDAFAAFCNLSGEAEAPVIFLTPMYDSGGHLLGLVIIGKVLTDTKKTRTEVLEDIGLIELITKSLSRNIENALLAEKLLRWDAKFRNLAENVRHGFILFDNAGKIEYVNGFVKQVLGYQSEQLIGKVITDFIHPDYAEEAIRQPEALQKDLGEGGIFPNASSSDYELVLFSSDGEAIPFLVTTMPEVILSTGGALLGKGWFSILVDLRHRREIERKQKELETMRNNFFAMVVHDMKVPLSAIYGYSDMLSTMNPQQVDEEYFHKIISRIHLSAKNINALVQEVLDFSKYESGVVELDLQYHSLVLCMDFVLEQNLHELNKKKIIIRREIDNSDFYFRFDFDKLVRVFGNIISNAIKFSKQNSAIEIIIQRETIESHPVAKVTIRDHGEGIASDETGLIFDAYRQAKSKTGPIGTGLGLSFARHIVELHGGKIWAESQLGIGTSIYFTIPMSIVKDDVSLNEDF